MRLRLLTLTAVFLSFFALGLVTHAETIEGAPTQHKVAKAKKARAAARSRSALKKTSRKAGRGSGSKPVSKTSGKSTADALASSANAMSSAGAISASNPSGRKLNTNFDFEDQIVNGKYQYPDEATTTVENEKELRDLLEVRKDFKDRLSLEATRQ